MVIPADCSKMRWMCNESQRKLAIFGSFCTAATEHADGLKFTIDVTGANVPIPRVEEPNLIITRILCYRKDDRAMRAI